MQGTKHSNTEGLKAEQKGETGEHHHHLIIVI